MKRFTLDELRSMGVVTRRQEQQLVVDRVKHEVAHGVEAQREAAEERKREARKRRAGSVAAEKPGCP